MKRKTLKCWEFHNCKGRRRSGESHNGELCPVYRAGKLKDRTAGNGSQYCWVVTAADNGSQCRIDCTRCPIFIRTSTSELSDLELPPRPAKPEPKE